MFFGRKTNEPNEGPKQKRPVNHRRHYRRGQTSRESILFALKTPEGDVHEGKFVDASIGGIAALFSLAEDPGLAVGDVVDVCVASKHHNTAVQTAATIIYIVQGDEANWRYAFEFNSVGDLYAQLDEFYAQIFNRREHRRILVPPEQAVRVKLMWGDHTIDCKLNDLSVGGMSVVLAEDKAAQLEPIKRLRIGLHLPDSDEELSGPGFIRSRSKLEGRTQFGIEFDLEHKGGFRRHRKKLRQFVEERRIAIERWERAIRAD